MEVFKMKLDLQRCFKKTFKVFSIAVLTMVLALTGCQKENPLESGSDQITRLTTQLTFLHPENTQLNKVLSIQKQISAAKGGEIDLKNDLGSTCSLYFPPNALDQDTLISVQWNTQGFISELGPHGLIFNRPVTIKLSYKDAVLTGVNEDRLRIWYYNDNTGVWELIGGTVDKKLKTVKALINHFSIYALAAE